MTPELAVAQPQARPGRKRDHTRDADILDAALEILAEEGYEGMTVDMVAARAHAGKATLYRRWPSKAELVIDAVACMKGGPTDPESLPDTGTLRGDLVAMIRPPSIRDGATKLRIMTAMASLVSRNPEFAEAAKTAIIEPRMSANRTLLGRAIERGEIRADVDVDLVAHIMPAMAASRTLFERQPVDRAFMLTVIDRIVLPAVGIPSNPDGSAG